MKPYLGLMIGLLVIIAGVDRGLGVKIYQKKKFWQFEGIVIILTILVDGLLATIPTEIFNPKIMTGLKIGQAPIENILFGVAMMWLNIILFEWQQRQK